MEERVTVVQTRTAVQAGGVVMEADDGAQMEVCRPGNIINVGFKCQGAVLTWGDMEKGLCLAGVDLSLFSFRELSENHDLISSRQLGRAVGVRVEVGLVEI